MERSTMVVPSYLFKKSSPIYQRSSLQFNSHGRTPEFKSTTKDPLFHRVSLNKLEAEIELAATTGSFDVAVAVAGLMTLMVRPWEVMNMNSADNSLFVLTVLARREDSPKDGINDIIDDLLWEAGEDGKLDFLLCTCWAKRRNIVNARVG
jgi:hypothetical protein